MSAVVVAFEGYKPNPQRPWQNHELAELYRAVDILSKAGLAIETDMGMSDEGEPWFAFCRIDNGEVIVHCARINGLFVATSIAIDQTFRGSNFREVIDSIVRYEPLKMPLSSAGSRLSLHPVMVLAAFVATALLFAKKADAHDFHAAVVSLTTHDAGTSGQKGLAAVKSTIGGFLQSLTEGSGSGKSLALAPGQPADADAPAALATLMAAAMTLVSSVTQLSSAEDVLPSGAAIVTPADAHGLDLFQTDSLSNASIMADHTTAVLQTVDDSAYQAWVGALLASGTHAISEAKPIAAAFLVTAHEPSPADASAPPIDPSHAGPAAMMPVEHLAFPLPLAPTESAAVVGAGLVAPSAPTQQSAPAGASAFDMSEVSPVALAILLGPSSAQPTGDPLDLLPDLVNLQANGQAPALAVDPVRPAGGGAQQHQQLAPATDVGQPTTPNANPPAAQVTDTPVSGGPQANPAPADQLPEFIWLTGNPNAGMAELVSYAEANHPLLDNPVLHPAAELISGVSLYNFTTGGHARLLVFESTAINEPFFEFTHGILMVSAQELGYTPSQAAMAMSTTVELANGSQVHILGVIDPAVTPIL